jgi:hypothetical protein
VSVVRSQPASEPGPSGPGERSVQVLLDNTNFRATLSVEIDERRNI